MSDKSMEVYPSGDRGLLQMLATLKQATKVNAIGILRGIQQAAFRAGREDGLGKGWQPIDTAPEHEDVLVYWPQRKYDENDMPTGEIVGGIVAVSSRSGQSWAERDSAFEASGQYFGDDYEFAEAPTHWRPLPAAPVASRQSEVTKA